jgi:hypothetical protein
MDQSGCRKLACPQTVEMDALQSHINKMNVLHLFCGHFIWINQNAGNEVATNGRNECSAAVLLLLLPTMLPALLLLSIG